jgi:pantoate--beta-alanine ligase
MRELERKDTMDPEIADAVELPSLAVIGAGRVGRSIARAARDAGLDVTLSGRRDALAAAEETEIALLCVPDSAIVDACATVSAAVPPLRYIGHTSGATGLDALQAAARRGARTFSIHPLQTVHDGTATLTGAPCAVSGSDGDARRIATALATRLGMRPFGLDEEHRATYHAAASIASNYLVALEELAAELLERTGADDARELLAPLVLRTAANWAEHGRDALTGPIARGDEETVERHLDAIAEVAPELLDTYRALAERTRALAAGREPAGGNREAKPEVNRMRTVRTKAELRTALDARRRRGDQIGVVPTMGALHGGHLSLIRAARESCDTVVVTLFVNPTQFGPEEDLDTYPHDEARDAGIAAAEGVDFLFVPPMKEIYPPAFATTVAVAGLADVMDGAPEHRGREHFRGVTTVVAKLLNIVQPDVAFFGQKDAQQTIVIRRMVEDLDFPVRIAVLPTVREPDGLAMSSRNRYLGADERERAAALSRALLAAERVAAGGEDSVAVALAAAREELNRAGIEPEYLEARDAEDLSPAANFNGRPVLVALAARLGRARLIDNIVIGG